jgi:hypothetical protein
LYYSGACGDAVAKVNGHLVGDIPKLINKLFSGGE